MKIGGAHSVSTHTLTVHITCFYSNFLLTGRGPPAPPPGSKPVAEPPRPAAAPKFGHLIVKCVKGVELKVHIFAPFLREGENL